MPAPAVPPDTPPAAPGREVELKLAVAPAHLRRLTAALTRAAGGPGRRKALINTYFDTDDGTLFHRGAALRLRHQGRQRLQTLKGPASSRGGALNRAEWEMPAPGGHLRLDLFDAPGARTLLHGVLPGQLRPLFSSTIQRRVFLLPLTPGDTDGDNSDGGGTDGGIGVEVALDTGVIQVPGQADIAVCEMELELTGAPADARTAIAALYDWALRFNALAPLSVESRTKAERGYAAAGLVAEKTDAAPLSPDRTAGETFATLLGRGLAQWARAEEVVRRDGDGLPPPEGVHQMRVALRRLRSCIGLFRPYLAAEEEARTLAADLATDLGALARALGSAREWDVFCADLLAPVALAQPDHPALAAAATAAQTLRADAYAAVRGVLDHPDTTALRLRLARWIDATAWADAGAPPMEEGAPTLAGPLHVLAARVMHRRWTATVKRSRHFARLDAPARHELRIALKKLRYATEFFRDLLPARPARRFIEQLSRVQDKLGHLNDVATLEAMITTLDAAPAVTDAPDWRVGMGMVLGWHAALLHAQEDALRATVAALIAAGPPPRPASA